jgi:hypothetical protein
MKKKDNHFGRSNIMKKRVFAVMLALSLSITSILVPVSAADLSPDAATINEYDYVMALEDASAEELEEVGLTKEDVSTLSTEFRNSIAERAQMTDKELGDLGYNAEEVALLRDYAQGEALTTAELRAIAGECTGDIKLYNCGTKYAQFSYTWDWDHAPAISLADSAAMKWVAFDSVSKAFDVTRYDLTCKIDYYVGPQKFYEGTGTEEPNLDFNVVNMQFNVLKSLGDQTYAYAKHGEVKVKVKVEEESDAIINYIKIAGLYGHTLIGAGSPTVAVGPGVGNISISLTGNTSVDNIGGRKAKIGAGNTFEYIQ